MADRGQARSEISMTVNAGTGVCLPGLVVSTTGLA